MSGYLSNMIRQIEALNMSGIVTQLVVAAALGFVIYLSYFIAHSGTVYSSRFNVSLVVLTVLTTLVMTDVYKRQSICRGSLRNSEYECLYSQNNY